ncbi:uncharacterized protein LOC118277410 isoform X1 [Spodoptera frugiperda]|uniref:Uncharacterized protein LOC118277410 isoform X1 n=1 Tax=Spodoptera frugiperda TaxID=7108 RepID=A0A9R0ER51_SPOFR|nr:uncharacterized protein LOC118277410 isoform X1 [Spodoptera frugiperda]
MHKLTLFILAAVFAVALAEGQYYVPRAYYTIDAEGHESAHVPLRRLRRSLQPYPYTSSAHATANANAESEGGSATAEANANARSGNGNWGVPSQHYGASNPGLLSAGMTRRQNGPVLGKSVVASTSVGLDSNGQGYYDQTASVN